MGVLDIIVRLLDQFEIIALPVGMLLHYNTTRQRMQKYNVLSKVILRVQRRPKKKASFVICTFVPLKNTKPGAWGP
jgi:hypothetical protein